MGLTLRVEVQNGTRTEAAVNEAGILAAKLGVMVKFEMNEGIEISISPYGDGFEVDNVSNTAVTAVWRKVWKPLNNFAVWERIEVAGSGL